MNELNNQWELWYHSITDTNWEKNSYKNISQINNLYDYRYIIDTFKQDHYQNGMFFCMKKDIFPNWEDPDNRSGGCLSFKVSSTKIIEEWNQLLLKCISENILDGQPEEINGISISPKKEFNIIKIWFRNSSFDYSSNFKEEENSLNLNNSLYKKHEF